MEATILNNVVETVLFNEVAEEKPSVEAVRELSSFELALIGGGTANVAFV
jgi:hypothetical protein